MSTKKTNPRPAVATPGATAPLKKGDHLYLVDGSGYIFRAFHALPPLTRPSDGLPLGAVHGFCSMLWKLVADTKSGDKPTHFAVIFDHSGHSFRNEIYDDYKAHRPPPPDELIPQFPLIRDATRAFNLACIEQEGFEADDIIATYAVQARDAGCDVTIVSSDKDLMQLVGDGITMLDTMKNKRVDSDGVREKFGVGPDGVVDVQALSGDSVDNVPGVPGIGAKSAGPIIREVGALANIIGDDVEIEVVRTTLKGTLKELQQNIDEIAGEAVKLSAGAQIGKVLMDRLDVPADKLKEDKKGNRTADTKLVEELAGDGNAFCQQLIRAREVNKIINSQLDTVITNADMARVSRELVSLRQDVDVKIPLDQTGVQEPEVGTILSFMKEMEFNKLTTRIAEALDVDAGDIPKKPTGKKKTEKLIGTVSDNDGTVAIGSANVVEAARESATATPIEPAGYETVSDLKTLEQWIANATDRGIVAVDTETDSLDAMQANLVGVSLATEHGKACYIPLAHGKGEGLDLDGAATTPQIPMRDALDALKPLMEDPAVLKIGQNLKYDSLVLVRYGVKIQPLDDTMLLSYALDGGRGGHGMDDLAQRHLDHTCIPFKQVCGTGKSQITFDRVPIDKATEYAAEDADVTLRLWSVLKPRLAADKMTTVYETLERPMVPVLMEMERAGIKVDKAILARLSGDFAQRLERLEGEIQDIAGKPFNVGSPKQLGEILFDDWKLPGGKKTKTGAWQTGAGVLDDLAGNEDIGEEPKKLVATILEWRQLSKLKSTYTDALQGFINPETKRIHTSFSLAAAATGRLASTEPNVQNIPIRTEEGREIRTAFIAEKGHKLISADYSQIELRVLAHIADIDALKQAFADGLDIHAMTASEMFGEKIEGMDPMIRRRAKAINFGIIYGISAFGLANQLGISRGEAGDYINRYFERFPGIKQYMADTVATVKAKGYVETIFGRRIHYPEINTKNPSMRGFFERAAINAPIQGSAADIIRRAMVRMPNALREAGLTARMLLQVHDELIFEVPKTEANKTIALVKSVMETAADPAVDLSVPLQVDAQAADNWDEAH